MSFGMMRRALLFFCVTAISLSAFSQSVTVSPVTLSFGSLAVGSSSTVHKATLKNGQTSAITINSITSNLADYTQTNNCPVSPAVLAVGASCTISLTFKPASQGARNATLTISDSGASSPQAVSLNGTGTAPVLQSIAVTPSTASVGVAGTQQFTATGTYSDGSTQNITTTVSWISSNKPVATVGLHTGLAKGVAAGSATLTASLGRVSGTGALTVTSPALKSIAVTPATPSIAAGKTQQFTATGTYSDGSTQNLTKTAIWTSSSTAVATINTAGLATGIAQGSATITATSGTISGSATLTVTAPVLTSIAVSPGSATIGFSSTQQFTATGTYSDGSSQDVTTTVSWISSKTSVATIKLHTGLATSVSAGTVTITASLGTVHGTATLTVSSSSTLVSITVSPSSASIPFGTTQQFSATGNYSDGSTQNLTTSASWSSSSPGVATVSNNVGTQGLATSVAVGSASISAVVGTISGSASLAVTPVALMSIAISPQSPIIALNATQQFTAAGTFSDGSIQDVTTTATWVSSSLTVATISNTSGSQGLASGIGVGTSTISASQGSISSSTELTVNSLTNPQAWTFHGPIGRHSHSAVFDPVSQQMIIFGGRNAATNAPLNDVWLGTTSFTQNDSFIAQSPIGTAPAARYGHIAVYDNSSNRMPVFGGNLGSTCANDIWILTGANGQTGTPAWIGATPSGTPPSPRQFSSGVYDPNSGSMIVFGGSDCATGYFNDVWVLTNASGQSASTWIQLSPSGTPPSARESSSAVYDPTHNVLTIYAGDAGSTLLSDVWVLSNANGIGGTPVWSKMLPTGTPPIPRTGHSATLDTVNNRMTIFGGSAGLSTLSDAWVLTTANGIGGTPAWAQIATQGTAPSLAYHSAVYDQTKNNIYVFAGISTEDKFQGNNHAFTLNGANGISSVGNKWVLGGAAVRYSHSAFYDPVTNGLFVFAGQHALGTTNFNDYWKESFAIGSSNLQWSLLTVAGSKPSARFGHTGVYDSGTNRMMVFAGATGFPAPCMNDYYVLENANAQPSAPKWDPLTPVGTVPRVRMRHASVYDSATNTLIIFGGYDCANTYYNDVWILQNANNVTGQPAWTQLQPSGTPPSPRQSSSAIYDPTTISLILYGGDSGAAPAGDMWILSHANGTGGTPAWTQLTASGTVPIARSGHTATYDSQNNVMTVYGGFDGTNILSDTWTLSGANGQAGSATWTQLPVGQARRFHSAEYDPISNEMVTFGGATGTAPIDPTADVYTLTDANNIQ